MPSPASYGQEAAGASRRCRRAATDDSGAAGAAQLYLPDEAYPRFPLPPGNEAYAHVDGLKMKQVVEEITAISRKSRDDGQQYWGRIPGTPYDRMTQDWVMDQFGKVGLKDVRRQELEIKELWYPSHGPRSSPSRAGRPSSRRRSRSTKQSARRRRISAQAVWVGLGTAADL